MRKEIEKFCDDIKEEYCLYLYEKGDELNFPYCCKLSADLLTSYLKMVCSDKFQYICTTNEKCYNHAWTYYNDGEEEFIIDFTNFQFTNVEAAGRMKKHEISASEFKQIIKGERVVFNPDDTYMYMTYDWMYPKEQECYGIIDDFDGKLDKEYFFVFLRQIFDTVFVNTVYY